MIWWLLIDHSLSILKIISFWFKIVNIQNVSHYHHEKDNDTNIEIIFEIFLISRNMDY